MKKRLFAMFLVLAALLSAASFASAKTLESARAENVFFYASDAEGKAILLKVIPFDDLKALAHGREDGKNYSISSTDNYPTTQYCEARGFTVPELVAYVKRVTGVAGAEAIGFSGGDTIRLMATDSYGNYNRSWTYDELYGVPRYYFEGLFDAKTGWNTSWEIAGEDDSKFGVTLDAYNARYKASDPYYEDKRAVFAGGLRTEPILAAESFSGRTTTAVLVASTEIGIADQIAANGGTAEGSLRDMLADTWSLRLSLPMTEADLMAAHRTAFDNFKWIYNLRLDMEQAPKLRSLGAVAEPVASVSARGDALVIEIACATEGASIYYSFDGAPQIPYTGPVTVDIAGRDLAADPVAFYMTAVREGFSDAGVITVKYPGLAPAFQTLYSGMAGEALRFAAQDGVAASDWAAWTEALNFVTLKTQSADAYVRVADEDLRFEADPRAIVFDGALFSETGAYGFVFHATSYADKSASVTIKKPAPAITPPSDAKIGVPALFGFDDASYQDGLTVYVKTPDGAEAMLPTNRIDRTRQGSVLIGAACFDLDAPAIDAPGSYGFSFVNNRFEPGTVELTVNFAPGPGPAPADVKASDWYYNAARYVTGENLFDAYDEAGAFGGNAPMTRAMLVTALYRAAASPDVAPSQAFSDVPAGTPLSAAVSWARDAGIVSGMGDGTFGPEASVTREQITAMLFRYARHTGADTRAAGDLTVFADADAIAAWAREALAWAVGARIVNGMGDGSVAPRGTATRAQVAQMLLDYGRV
ncbi:MAG: S-layer homology domain-containing protein [Clostridiales Family XIII bacterium]|nr:S-layer homology domain-containing protein [Clostridiales Family XIII bacterium]